MRYDVADLPTHLLEWYDIHARSMPWRIGPADRASGVTPDAYRVWLSEVMLQQTTVAAVRDYFLRFTEIWPRVTDLAAAEDADVMAAWAGLGYYARARNLLKCARVVATEYDGQFPRTREVLLTLPGIGPYTAAAVAAIAFDEQATVVDGNVERVMARYYRVETPLPKAKGELTELAEGLTPAIRPGDYAQAVMDLGATICTPRSPACGICPWMEGCAARRAGVAPDLPRKAAKAAKPVRRGIAYVAQREDGAWLLETRPAKGLLGGMLGWPGSDWGDTPTASPPVEADWHEVPGEVRHTFTHFHLRLQVFAARVPENFLPHRGEFRAAAEFSAGDLPTVMRKCYDLASQHGDII
ncbi:A/G-specific adenine glycosylase [Actibacterium sp. 188UL27-1]|uniref:A/G-specific adenine glycosylase n=1 Tax=Actibacterium sp. 188UL27-1 TaxID=2786961 RepID=UPI00195EE704|nr:A/G-specific adenine glycosylase [Actibacterium sp. 188UL27-1]MBM7070159.1 A/G-specific adenine glycosylase [Actibacterium sp. 188UL27-1]